MAVQALQIVSRYAAAVLLIPCLIIGPAGAEETPVAEAIAAPGPGQSSAQAPGSLREPAPGWSIDHPGVFSTGVGPDLAGTHGGEPYRGLGSAAMPFSGLSYRGERFAQTGPDLSYLLFGRERPWSLSTILSSGVDGYDAGESDYLRGMDDRRVSAEGGFEASYQTDVAEFSLSTRNDLRSEHDGYRVDAGIKHSWWLGRFVMTPELSYSYWDGARSDYYFGVRPGEAAPGRRAYNLDSTGNWGLSLMGFTNLTPRWFMLAGAKYTYYDEDIEDSPIVDKYYSYRLYLGFGYKFGSGAMDGSPGVNFDSQP
jgi:outer membrane protein